MKVVSFLIPQPVSANRIWRTTKQGRIYLNPNYRQWRKDALSSLWEQKPAGGFPFFDGKFRLEIILPVKTRIDEDNAVKPVADFLQGCAGLVANDKHMFGHEVSRSEDVPKGMCRVVVTETMEAA